MEKFSKNGKYYITADFLIEINKVGNEQPHTHDFIEFVYMLKGRSLHIIDGKEYPLKRGDLLIINYNQTHSFHGEGNANFSNILIKPAFINESIRESRDLNSLFESANYREFKELINQNCNLISFSPEEKNCFEYILLLLYKELQEKEIGHSQTTRAGLTFLLTMIFRKMCNSSTLLHHDFTNVLYYIEQNYMQNITATELAELCHYNPSYFCRLFKKQTGITFSQYVKQLRISKACHALDTGRQKVDAVCFAVGYTNRTNFYKHFKEIVGVTPLEYKKLHTPTAGK